MFVHNHNWEVEEMWTTILHTSPEDDWLITNKKTWVQNILYSYINYIFDYYGCENIMHGKIERDKPKWVFAKCYSTQITICFLE